MKNISILILIFVLAIKATQAQVPSYVPSNGLVGWWPFNGNANDESGNGNYGTAMNGVALTSDRNGNANSAYNFDGVDDYITVSDDSLLNPSCLTISAWVNSSADATNVQSGAHGIVTKWYQQNNCGLLGDNYNVCLTQQNGTSVLVGSTIANSQVTTSLSSVNNVIGLNSWHHIVFVHNPSNGQKLFVDDSLIGFNNLLGNLCITTNDLIFGADNFAGNIWRFFQGSIDDIGIWNRALDSCEIKDLYYASLGNCCQASFSSQPQNQNANSGTNATFIAQSSSANPSYQWQSDLGLGWQNLSNAGQYSGVNKDTLSVTNLSAANNNQLFRCILMSGTCSDTSAVATLSVSQTNGLNTLQNEIISIYPNPATNQITILSNAVRYPLSYNIYNELGQALLVGELNSKNTSLDISSLAPGNYLMLVGTKHVSFVKNK
jgi:hypothetical protein